jgi:hypothetical protein
MKEKIELFTNKIKEATFLVNKALMQIDQQRDDQPNAFLYTWHLKQTMV